MKKIPFIEYKARLFKEQRKYKSLLLATNLFWIIIVFLVMRQPMDKALVNTKSRTEWESLIKEWIHNETDRQMLVKRLLDGTKIEPLAEEFELSTVQCQKRLKKAEAQLFKNI